MTYLIIHSLAELKSVLDGVKDSFSGEEGIPYTFLQI